MGRTFLCTVLISVALCLASINRTSRVHIGEGNDGVGARNGTRVRVGPMANSSVLVLQVADDAYARKWRVQMDTNKKWARCAGYDYEVRNVSKGGNSYTAKVGAIHSAVELSREGDWIVYLDGDVYFNRGDSCDALERILPSNSELDHLPCEWIAAASETTIDTGVLVLRATNSTRTLLRRWLERQRAPDPMLSFGAADQLSLQDAVVERLWGDGYRGECARGDQGARNACFGRHVPASHRSMQHLCMIQCNESVPLQYNGCGGYDMNMTNAVFVHLNQAVRVFKKYGLFFNK